MNGFAFCDSVSCLGMSLGSGRSLRVARAMPGTLPLFSSLPSPSLVVLDTHDAFSLVFRTLYLNEYSLSQERKQALTPATCPRPQDLAGRGSGIPEGSQVWDFQG